jgi:hypothetical protein
MRQLRVKGGAVARLARGLVLFSWSQESSAPAVMSCERFWLKREDEH